MRRVTTLAAASLLAGPALAQGFNDAPPHGQGQQPAFENQTRAPALADRALNRQVVAEGLEQRADVKRVRQLGATLGQGWYFARAMSTEDVLAWTLDRIGAEDDAVISDGGDGASSTGWVRS